MNYVPELFACTRFFSFMFWLKLNIQALLDICVFLLTSHSYNWSCLLNEGFFYIDPSLEVIQLVNSNFPVYSSNIANDSKVHYFVKSLNALNFV